MVEDQARRRQTLKHLRPWTGTCGVVLHHFVLLTRQYIRVDSEAIWTMQTVSLVIGEYIGWIRSFGGRKKNILKKFIPQPIVLFDKTVPMHRIHKQCCLSLNHSLRHGSIVYMQ